MNNSYNLTIAINTLFPNYTLVYIDRSIDSSSHRDGVHIPDLNCNTGSRLTDGTNISSTEIKTVIQINKSVCKNLLLGMDASSAIQTEQNKVYYPVQQDAA